MPEESNTLAESESIAVKAETEAPATWHNPDHVLRFAVIARITGYVLLALTVVGLGYVTYQVIHNASMTGQNAWSNLLMQYLAFVSLIMAVVVIEGIAYFLEIMVDIEENTRQ
jgi:hypothetical protein